MLPRTMFCFILLCRSHMAEGKSEVDIPDAVGLYGWGYNVPPLATTLCTCPLQDPRGSHRLTQLISADRERSK
ncbi:hypothetical protein B0H67DRAFT_562919 [Lasiosphaeris hirsuta]|uniref:Secreted protein n=1 Tax=Lasiosphaeris hirsuta TaxID=260670 RepID=A0AA40BAT5_9PEZI|nr:hypothetical protein B0H67DRAFT_562919 [Lasiosphaeris hirsuta]